MLQPVQSIIDQGQTPSTDPWLLEFIKIVQSENDEKSRMLWTNQEITKRVSEAHKKIERLKEILSEMKRIRENSLSLCSSDIKLKEFIEESIKIKSELENFLPTFDISSISFMKWKLRLRKTLRNKKWKKKRKELQKVEKANKEKEYLLMDTFVNDWLEIREAENREKLKQQQRTEKELKIYQQEKKQASKDSRKISVLIKLEELRQLRRSTLGSKGNEIPSLEEIIDQYRKRQMESRVGTRVNSSVLFSPRKNLEIADELGNFNELEQKDVQIVPEVLLFKGSSDQPESVIAFYNQADESVEKLIQIRKLWDTYLVTPGTGGNRIPQHWVPVVEPSSDLWTPFIQRQTSP